MTELKVNLYDKTEVISDEPATVISPDKTVFTLVPFTRQKLGFSYDDHGYETVTAGEEYSVVRFYPSQKGEYVLRFSRRSPVRVVVSDCENRGFVRADEKDKRYFACDDGTPFFVIGLNMAFVTLTAVNIWGDFGKEYLGLRQFDRWFKKASENGVNVVRIWLGHEYLCPDADEAGVLDTAKLEKIEAVIDLAKSYGLKTKLTIEQFRHFDYDLRPDNSYTGDVLSKFNKKLYADGKRCENISEWLTDDKWIEAWLKKIAALAARFSGDPSIFMIELWNEMNATSPEYVGWNEKMMPEVKRLFPNTLVTNSLSSYDCAWARNEYARFPWDKCDVVQMHRYLDQGAEAKECRESLIGLLRSGITELARPDKPFIVAETGAVNDCHSGPFRYYPADDDGILFCDAVYTPAFCGAAGTGFIWHWDERYVEAKNLYRLYRPIARLFGDVKLSEENFEPVCYETDDVILLLLRGKTVSLGYVRNKNYSWQNVLRDGKTPESVSVSFVIRANSPELVRIIDGETATVSNGDRLTISNLLFGTLLRW